jgi:hypothetical protein
VTQCHGVLCHRLIPHDIKRYKLLSTQGITTLSAVLIAFSYVMLFCGWLASAIIKLRLQTVSKILYCQLQTSTERIIHRGHNHCHHCQYHHHHWLDSPTWALAFLRSFCQLKYPAIASSDFVTRVFSRVRLSAPRPTPGYPAGPMFSVRVVSLSWLLTVLKCQDFAFCSCMT